MEILDDPAREFVSSDFVKLEVSCRCLSTTAARMS